MLYAILMLAPLILFHELGHYLVGRWCGVKADAFSVGFGKELWGRTDRRGTRWKLSAIPLGGYVQMLDERGAFQLRKSVATVADLMGVIELMRPAGVPLVEHPPPRSSGTSRRPRGTSAGLEIKRDGRSRCPIRELSHLRPANTRTCR